VLSDQAVQPHQPPFPAGHFHFGVALNQVTDDCTAGLAMEEHDLLHQNRAMEYDLIDVCGPGRISFVAQLSVEIQLRLSLYQARRRVQSGLRPAPGPRVLSGFDCYGPDDKRRRCLIQAVFVRLYFLNPGR